MVRFWKRRKKEDVCEDKTNGKKIGKYRLFHYGFLAGTLAFGGYALSNLWEMHKFDKYVIKNIEIAANVPSAGNSSESTHGLSMETALSDARQHTRVARLDNPAIIWKTPLTDVAVLEQLLDKSIERSQQIEQFKDSFKSGDVKDEYPQWIEDAHDRINPDVFAEELSRNGQEYSESGRAMLKTLEELSKSEYGQRMANEYEALNNSVAGGTRTSAKNLKEKHRSLLDTLDKAGGVRSIIRFQADDFKEAHANVFVGYLMANMGDLNEGLKQFYKAKKLMDKYPDDKNLALIRNTPELSQKIIKGLIDSSISELEALNEDSAKYSSGWWKRLTYYNQSIGGQSNPSIQDMSEMINDRYWSRAWWTGLFGLASLYVAGRYGKKLRLSKQYQVMSEKEE